MDKLNKGLNVVFDKIQAILTGTIKTVSEAATIIVSRGTDTVFSVGGEFSKNIGILLGVLNDNITRIKNIFDGESK